MLSFQLIENFKENENHYNSSALKFDAFKYIQQFQFLFETKHNHSQKKQS